MFSAANDFAEKHFGCHSFRYAFDLNVRNAANAADATVVTTVSVNVFRPFRQLYSLRLLRTFFNNCIFLAYVACVALRGNHAL